MDNINKLSKNFNEKKIETNSKKPYELQQLEQIYVNFQSKAQKSDFCNSPRRYIIELEQVKQLKELSISYQLDDEVEKWAKKEEEIKLKLEEFGIKTNN